jgi:predicted regulator of Ras-like GTPase activity (Roadblock/LC7/MglB family)
LELALVVDLAGLLEHVVGRIPGAETAILLTADGKATASWGGSPRTAGEVSLLASTLQALAEAAARYRRLGPVWRTIVALDHQTFALAPAGPHAVLGVTLNGGATLDSVLTDTATAAERAGRVLAAHDVHFDTPASPAPTLQRRKHRRSLDPHPLCHPARGTAPVTTLAPGRSAAGLAQLTGCDPNPSDDELERMLTRLRSL